MLQLLLHVDFTAFVNPLHLRESWPTGSPTKCQTVVLDLFRSIAMTCNEHPSGIRFGALLVTVLSNSAQMPSTHDIRESSQAERCRKGSRLLRLCKQSCYSCYLSCSGSRQISVKVFLGTSPGPFNFEGITSGPPFDGHPMKLQFPECEEEQMQEYEIGIVIV